MKYVSCCMLSSYRWLLLAVVSQNYENGFLLDVLRSYHFYRRTLSRKTFCIVVFIETLFPGRNTNSEETLFTSIAFRSRKKKVILFSWKSSSNLFCRHLLHLQTFHLSSSICYARRKEKIERKLKADKMVYMLR